ncbi:endothelin-converting enzyme 1-like [Dermacentor variabilis]|uniref:endothelin-converting enzyme 1-like n=1 Tax=Dermacentor variabilis TaxID=34621 RepID=UPI003F5B1C21
MGEKSQNYIKYFLTDRATELRAAYLQTQEKKLGSTGTQHGSVISPMLFNLGCILRGNGGYIRNKIPEAVYLDFTDNEKSYGDYWVKSRLLVQKLNDRVPGYEYALEIPGNNSSKYLLFNYMMNSVDVAIGVVSRPLFYPQGTQAMLYGGLGFSMALQMVKTMDSEGLKWHPHHGLAYSIKSRSTMSAYQAKDGCLIEQGFPSVFPEIPAMEIAYAAYAKSNETHPPIDYALPEDKVFFLTLCYMTCSQRGERNPSAADCNKAVRGSAAFAEAFSCFKGSAMNPEKTCSFF